MGGGIASYLPEGMKRPFWNTMAKIRHALFGDGSSTTKANSGSSNAGTIPVGEGVDKTIAALAEGLNNLASGDNIALARERLKQLKTTDVDKYNKVKGLLNFAEKAQGASSTPTPPNAKELGLPQPIANAPKPKASQPAKSSNSVNPTPQAYHGRYDNSGDPNTTGISSDDVHLRARYLAMNTAKHNIEDLRTELRGVGAGMTEAEFKAYCEENGIKYTPPAKGSYWSKID